MSRVKVVEVDDKPVAYVVPADLWERVRDLVEDAEDAADLERFDREDDGFRIPMAVVKATLEGVHPVRAWREHRGLSARELAAAVGTSVPYLNQIENGKRAGGVGTLKALARKLEVPLDALVSDAG